MKPKSTSVSNKSRHNAKFNKTTKTATKAIKQSSTTARKKSQIKSKRASAKITHKSEYQRVFATLTPQKKVTNYQQALTSIEKGLPVECIDKLSANMQLSKSELLKDVNLEPRTISRRKKNLTTDESDKIVRLSRIFTLATDVFKDKEYALLWLKSPQVALMNKKPLDLLSTELGAREVENVLMQIRYGVYI